MRARDARPPMDLSERPTCRCEELDVLEGPEAIAYAGSLASFRGARTDALLAQDEDDAAIEARIEQLLARLRGPVR